MNHLDDILFLVRTRGFGDMARLLAKRLSDAGATVAIVVDERDGTADCAPFTKISLDASRLAALGATGLPDNWGWFCGDMCYYLAAAIRPGFDRYVLVESDVFIPASGVKDIVSALSALRVQVVAAQLGVADKPHRYSMGLRHFDIDPGWGCIFPLTSVTPDVIAAMQNLRIAQLNQYPNAPLNDEAVLAGAVARDKFTFAPLEDIAPDQIGTDTFNTNPPHLFEALLEDVQEHRLFHPVVPFQTIMDRLEDGEKAYSRHRLRKVLRCAPRAMRRALLRQLQD